MLRAPQEVQAALQGLLPFVHTPFAADGALDQPRLREHLQHLETDFVERPTCYFVACGAGEFWSLGLEEYRALVRAAVETVGVRVPVLAGVGYGTPLALEYLRAAEAEGADGVLVFPPYLVSGPQEGLYRHYAALAAATPLAILIYNRDNAIFAPETVTRLADQYPNIVGLKDGAGDLDRLAAMRRLLGERLTLMNGMPSAELFAPAYTRAGIRAYSPSGIEFVPELAWVFDRALVQGNDTAVARLIEAFYRPYTELRNQVPGYGVALVKAALRLRGRPSGGVRPPLVDPSPVHEAQLQTLLTRALCLAQELGNRLGS